MNPIIPGDMYEVQNESICFDSAERHEWYHKQTIEELQLFDGDGDYEIVIKQGEVFMLVSTKVVQEFIMDAEEPLLEIYVLYDGKLCARALPDICFDRWFKKVV